MELAEALRKHNTDENSLVERNIVAKNIADELFKSLAPRGTYNIPHVLDERRFQYGIPNGCFEQFPVFDKVYVYQIPLRERSTYSEGGAIIMPEARQSNERSTAPRGIIVSAGLQALDSLRSTGIDIGHIIRFKKFAPFIQPIEVVTGVELTVMVIRDGDIVASEDLARSYHAREISIVNVSPNEAGYDFRFARTNLKGDIIKTGKKIAGYYDPSV